MKTALEMAALTAALLGAVALVVAAFAEALMRFLFG